MLSFIKSAADKPICDICEKPIKSNKHLSTHESTVTKINHVVHQSCLKDGSCGKCDVEMNGQKLLAAKIEGRKYIDRQERETEYNKRAEKIVKQIRTDVESGTISINVDSKRTKKSLDEVSIQHFSDCFLRDNLICWQDLPPAENIQIFFDAYELLIELTKTKGDQFRLPYNYILAMFDGLKIPQTALPQKNAVQIIQQPQYNTCARVSRFIKGHGLAFAGVAVCLGLYIVKDRIQEIALRAYMS